jgi:cupin fold WbuC family metalloprotein
MALIQKSADVFHADGPISLIAAQDIQVVREAADKSPKKRARINAHPNSADLLHEMIIAIKRGSYIRPHKHPGKSEAFHIVEGAVDIVIFDDAGEISRVVKLSEKGGADAFYYRMSRSFFHTLVIRSNFLIVHEITNGPFLPGATVFADFAPPEDDAIGGARYQLELADRTANFSGGT